MICSLDFTMAVKDDWNNECHMLKHHRYNLIFGAAREKDMRVLDIRQNNTPVWDYFLTLADHPLFCTIFHC